MQLNLSALALVVAGLAATASADTMMLLQCCTVGAAPGGGTMVIGCENNRAQWYPSGPQSYGLAVPADAGCWNPKGSVAPGPPALNNVCIDMSMARGHFYFDGQNRRCLVRRTMDLLSVRNVCSFPYDVYESRWDEVNCTW